MPKRTVVVPIDLSPDSMAAVDTALELAEEPSGVHVVHVMREPSPIEPDVEWQEIDYENRRRHAVEAIRERFTDGKYDALQIEVDFGDPGHRIADYAERVHAELIVIPSHGRGGLKRMLLGSTAERVIRFSHCPVLVLRD
jgi:nucleotide-binding universal stress UspA family protein